MSFNVQATKIAASFLSEAMILFLLLFPFFHYGYGWVPYGSYLAAIIVICTLFTLYTRLTNQLFWYILSIPVLIAFLTALDFPLWLSAVLSVLLTWRYVQIRKDTDMNRELLYVQVMSILVILLVLLYQQEIAIFYLIFQLLVIIIGFQAGHIFSSKQDTRKSFSLDLAKLLTCIVCISSLTISLLYIWIAPFFFKLWDIIVVNLWNGFIHVFAYVASIPMYFLGLLLDKLPEGEPAPNQSTEAPKTLADMEQTDPKDFTADMSYLYWILIGIFILLLILFIRKIIRKKFEQSAHTERQSMVHYKAIKQENKEPFIDRITANLFKQPKNPVRKLMFQFERKTDKVGKGRKQHETLQEWLTRIDFEIDTRVYQKVRYGHGQATEKEIETLKQGLQKWQP